MKAHLSDEQAREVLQVVEARHYATIGVNWAMIEDITDEMFPPQAEDADAGQP